MCKAMRIVALALRRRDEPTDKQPYPSQRLPDSYSEEELTRSFLLGPLEELLGHVRRDGTPEHGVDTFQRE